MSEINLSPLRARILELSMQAREGHVPSAFSILDIIFVFYNKVSKRTNSDLDLDDLFLLSKGHGCLALYVVLEHFELIEKAALDGFGSFNSDFGGHPDRTKSPHITASTGSLGHGLPIAVGLAMSRLRRGVNGSVCCLIGDGEANEGAVWEAALLASQHNLNNLTCLIDNNQSGERAVHISAKLSKMFTAFDWEVLEIDGHDHCHLETAIFETGTVGGPRAIICNTVKGKGVRSMERAPEWHHRSPNPVEYSEFLKELSN